MFYGLEVRSSNLLGACFFAAQFFTILHNTEFGSKHQHNNQICEFVLHSDRSGSTDTPSLVNFIPPEYSDILHYWTLYTSDYRTHLVNADARAPPIYS